MKAYHALVTGSSGGGKTTYLREIQDTVDACSLYLTSKDHESGVAGTRVAGRTALNTAVSRASQATDVRCKWYGADYDGSIRIAREWAHDVREHMGWPTQIIVDEAQDSGLADGDGPLVQGLHEDRDRGIKWVPATQDPQDLRDGYGAIKQCRHIVWCGPPNSFHKGFLSYYDLVSVDLPTEPYHYAVIKPSYPPEVVYRGTTKERYA